MKKNKLKAICATCHTHRHAPLKFPKGFLWGAATSAHQVEGRNNNNDWWAWEQEGGHIKNKDTSGKATDHYNRYQEDFDLAKNFKHNTHRFSLEWSRIEPKPGVFNKAALDHYEDVLKALKKRKLEPMVTLHHFTNPLWFSKKGGWQKHSSVHHFNAYVEKVVKRYKKYVTLWCTINEPFVYASNSYTKGNWPPQKKSFWATPRVLSHMADAHKMAYKTIHRAYPKNIKPQVGFAHNHISFTHYGNGITDYLYEWLLNNIWNGWFYRKTKGTHDFIGLNYYFYHRIKKGRGAYAASDADRDVTDMGWEIYPGGIFRALIELSTHNLPIYITENGLASVNDHRRSRFIVAHLKEVYHAIKAGVDVRGYYHWSLTDNFEWDKGFAPRFGLVHIDYDDDFERTPRNSANVYARICKENAINHDLMRFVGHDAEDEPPVS